METGCHKRRGTPPFNPLRFKAKTLFAGGARVLKSAQVNIHQDLSSPDAVSPRTDLPEENSSRVDTLLDNRPARIPRVPPQSPPASGNDWLMEVAAAVVAEQTREASI